VDVEELRKSMRAILDTENDVAILGFLGIDKADIPEAIKTLQRMREVSGGDKQGGGEMDELVKDTLDQEFIEAGIDALRRMSDCVAADLPYWTITPWVFSFFFLLVHVPGSYLYYVALRSSEVPRSGWDSFLKFFKGNGMEERSPLRFFLKSHLPISSSERLKSGRVYGIPTS
jgi:hypothetical protein